MKFTVHQKHIINEYVALFTRAWIEITKLTKQMDLLNVALFTRAWIEMTIYDPKYFLIPRRPLHEGVD